MFYESLPLWGSIETTVDIYAQERESHWKEELVKLGREAEQAFAEIERIAVALIKGAGDLASPSTVPLARALLQRAPDDLGTEKLVLWIGERISIDLGWDMAKILRDASLRTWNLAVRSQPVKPGRRTAEFLKRVGRCYIYGFMPECVILCRSVLDAEFEAQVSNDECIDILGARRPLNYSLDDKIAVAAKLGRITPETAAVAHGLREAGNRAVHRQPDATQDAIDVIAKTMQVIRELSDKE